MNWLQLVINIIGTGFVGGITIEIIRRGLDYRRRKEQARAKVITALTKLEVELYLLEWAFRIGGSMSVPESCDDALDALAIAAGEARVDLSEEVIDAVMLVYVTWFHDLQTIREGKEPSFMLPNVGDLEADTIEIALKLLNATSPQRLWKNAERAAKSLPRYKEDPMAEVQERKTEQLIESSRETDNDQPSQRTKSPAS